MKLRRLLAVARKEWLHIVRDPRSLILAIGLPMFMIILFGYALTLDVDRVPFLVLDRSQTPASREFIARFEGSRYFELRRSVWSYREIEAAIDRREVLLALVLEVDFAADLGSQRPAPVQAIVDGADSNTAAIVMGYAQGIVRGYNGGVALERIRRRTGARSLDLPVLAEPRVWFNPDLESKNYIIPGLIAVVMGLIAALLTSLTIAREWERGTMEQLVSTPVRPVELILGKLAPYFIIGMVDVVIAVLMAVFVFNVPLRGSVTLLLGGSAVFIVATLAQGILISTVAKGQLLASQLAMVSTFLPAYLLSGFMFAISNMPPVVQGITLIIPARYFVAMVKGIYLRGVGMDVLWRDGVPLLCFGAALTTIAVLRLKKRLD